MEGEGRRRTVRGGGSGEVARELRTERPRVPAPRTRIEGGGVIVVYLEIKAQGTI